MRRNRINMNQSLKGRFSSILWSPCDEELRLFLEKMEALPSISAVFLNNVQYNKYIHINQMHLDY